MQSKNFTIEGTSSLKGDIERIRHTIQEGWKHAKMSTWSESSLASLIRDSLKLSALADTHKLNDLSSTAKALHLELRHLSNAKKTDAERGKCRQCVETFLSKLEGKSWESDSDNVVTLYPSTRQHVLQQKLCIGRKSVGVFEHDMRLAALIAQQLSSEGYEVHHFCDLSSLKSAMQARQLDLVLVDLLLPNCPLSSAIAVEEFSTDNPKDIPVIMLSENADLNTRLIALRGGIKAYLTKPVEENELIDTVNQSINRQHGQRARVLVCDDDPMLTEFYEIALEEEGFIVNAVNDPTQLLAKIEDFKPDVITLDYLMPGCNGLEIAEILRGDPRYNKTPIVFMSASEEAAERKSVMGLFGNSFLEKPVDIQKLSETLSEMSAKAKALAEKVGEAAVEDTTASKRMLAVDAAAEANESEASSTLENRDHFLAFLKNELERAKSGTVISNTQCLALATIDNTSRAEFSPERALEKFFSDHHLVNQQYCKLESGAFLLLLEGFNNENANQLLAQFMQSLNVDQHSPDASARDSLSLSVSVGAMPISNDMPESVNEVISQLHSANNIASKKTGNNYHWVEAPEPELSAEPSDKIIAALKKKSFLLAFQSIIKPDSDEHIFETLVRLKDEDGHIHTPPSFIHSLDNTIEEGSYHLDRWVVENAFKALENINGRGAAEFSLVIKLSPNLKQVERLMPFIFNITSNTRLRGANRIYFSLSEKAVLSDITLAKKIIEAFHTANCGFMLEHCSAGEQIIEAFQHLDNIDFVKLHPSLSKDSSPDQNVKKCIRKIRLALKEKGEIIAGAVEDAKTFAKYWEMNIRFFQGFFIHRPNERMHYQAHEPESLVLES